MRLLFAFQNISRMYERVLFSLLPSSLSPRFRDVGPEVEMTDAARDLRSGDEWLLSAISYLEFKQGKSWRKLHRAGERYNLVRWYYLDAIRLLLSIRRLDAPACDCKRCATVPKKNPQRASDGNAVTWSGAQIRRAAKVAR